MPNQPKTPARSVRVGEEMWRAAQEKAAERGETVTDVIVLALASYVRSGNASGEYLEMGKRLRQRIHTLGGWPEQDGALAEALSLESALAQSRFLSLADDLDYYARKTTGGTATDGYEDASRKIRQVIDGTYFTDELTAQWQEMEATAPAALPE